MRCSKLLLVVALTISTCGTPAANSTPAVSPRGLPGTRDGLTNTQWALRSFGAAGGESPVVEGTAITLKFDADGRAGGSGGCNFYASDYEVRDDRLTFRQIISTKKACVEQGVLQQEQRYFRALESAGRFELTDGQLTIFYDDGWGELNFVKAPASTPRYSG